MLARGATYHHDQSLTPAPTQQDESLIIAACLAGDERAWETLIAKYSRLIYSIPFRYGLSDNEAADIFQSVCLKLLEHLQNLRDCTKLSSWLITTTSRECWSTVRKRAWFPQREANTTEEEYDPQDLSPLPEETTLLMEEQQEVRVAFQFLPSRCQRLLWYLFYDRSGLSYAQIGKQLGIPEGSIGPQRARCLEKLRTLLEETDCT